MGKAVGELKSKKLTSMVRPSVLSETQKIVQMRGDNINNLVNELLIKFNAENQKYLQKYEEVMEMVRQDGIIPIK